MRAEEGQARRLIRDVVVGEEIGDLQSEKMLESIPSLQSRSAVSGILRDV